MGQLSLLEEFSGPIETKLDVLYDGSAEELTLHQIDASLYARSINGYSVFIENILKEYGVAKNINIRIIAHKNGSFLTIIGITGFVLTALPYVSGKDPKEIRTYVIDNIFNISKTFINKLANHYGDINVLIESIKNDYEINDDEKEKLIKSMTSQKIRKGLDDFTSVFDRYGYEAIEVTCETGNNLIIKSDKRKNFIYIPPDIHIQKEFKGKVSILYLSPDNARWQFIKGNGNTRFWADIEDENFIQKTRGEKFSELSGKIYFAYGTVTITRKAGEKKGTTNWILYKVDEFQEQINFN